MAVDPINTTNTATGSKAADALKSLSGDYENFLKLLTVQLQNQDPTEPTDVNQLTQQIAILSQVEQQINANANLEKLVAMYSTTQYNSAVNYIGRQIEAPGNAGALYNGQAQFAYYLNDKATVTNITIKDASDNVVYTGTGPTGQGRNEFVWNGKNNLGQAMPDGVYTISLEAKDGGGNVIASQAYTTGIVNAVDSADGQVYLSIGGASTGLSIPIGNVTSIRLASNDNSQG